MAGVEVAYFGAYRADYARNRNVQAALRRAGARVVELRLPQGPPLWRWIELARLASRRSFDVLFVGYPGFVSMPLAWLVGHLRGAPVVFDAFLSLHETRVIDRQEVPRGLGPLFRLVEWLACLLADVVLVDTAGQAAFLAQRTRQNPGRFRWLWVGADEETMVPCRRSSERDHLLVATYGNFAPIQGVTVILDAAAVLQAVGHPVSFVVIGDGPGWKMALDQVEIRQLHSVELVGRIPYADLRRRLCEADVCLGLFAGSAKAQRVVPNKVFDALCLGRPVVTAASPAVAALLRDGVEVVLVPPEDPKSLAAALVELLRDPPKRSAIAEAGRRRFVECASTDALSRDLNRWLPRLVRR